MRYLFIIITLSSFIVGCKSNLEEVGNKPPEPFTVTAILEPNGKYIKASWIPTKDPEGDYIEYKIVGVDTITITSLDGIGGLYFYTLKNIPFNYELNGKVIACDSKGACTTSNFTVKTSSEVIFADTKFEKFLIDTKIDSDGILDGKISKTDAEKVKDLAVTFTQINGQQPEIEDLSGTELFPNLENLIVWSGKLKYVDLSKNRNLKTIIISNCQIEKIDLTKNINLETIDLTGNKKLSSLDVTQNLNLKTLYFGGAIIKKINLSANKLIENLGFDLSLSDIDLSNNVNLKCIGCFGNTFKIGNVSYSFGGSGQSGKANLLKVDLKNNTKLESINLDGAGLDEFRGKLEDINLTNCSNLKFLSLRNNAFSNIDLSNNKFLERLDIGSNNFQKINLSNNLSIKNLDLSNNNLEILDLGSHNVLSSVDVYSNKLTEIKLPQNLKTYFGIRISRNQLIKLDLINVPWLLNLECEGNNLENIDLRKIYYLDKLSLDSRNNLKLKSICVPDVEKAKKVASDRKWLIDISTEITKCN